MRKLWFWIRLTAVVVMVVIVLIGTAANDRNYGLFTD